MSDVENLDVQGLTLGLGLGAEKVNVEICPECPFKTAYCIFRLSLWLANPDLAFVCKGMRVWETRKG